MSQTMKANNQRFYDSSANSRADYLDWDIASAEARSCAAPHYDLSKQEDRQRCFLAHCAETYAGGFGLWCQLYGFDRDNMDAFLYQGEQPNERNARQYAAYQDEFNSLAANSPTWAEINNFGARRGE